MKSRYLTESEISLIFSRLLPSQRLLFELSISSGLRIGDCLKIKTGDISRGKNGEVLIRYRAEKTKKPGVVHLIGTVAEHLYSFKKHKKGYVWPSNSKSGHITRQTAWNWMKAAAAAAGVDLKGVSPHSLRKCFAVRIRHEKGIEAAQRALQHSNCAQTAIYAYADIYAGADPNAAVLWCQIDELLDLIAERLERREQKKTSD